MSSVVIPSEQLNRFQRLRAPWQLQASGQNQEFSGTTLVVASSVQVGEHGTVDTREPPAVIGLTRLYCNQGERFLLIDVAPEDASQRAEELVDDGWEIEAEIPV